MANELIHVPFHGDVIQAVQTEDGNEWVVLKPACEKIGVSMQGQTQKLKKKAWARTKMILVRDSAGREQETECLHRESLPMWLATIEASRVKEEYRAALILYQKEAARVLADYFLRGKKGPRLDSIPREVAEAFALALKPMLRGMIAELLPPIPEQRWSIHERCKKLGWRPTTVEQRKLIYNLLPAKMVQHGFSWPSRAGAARGAELLFPECHCAALDEAINEVWLDEQEKEDNFVPPLFRYTPSES